MVGTATLPSKPKSKSADPRGDDPDVRLMLRVRDDDQGAYAELLERYGARIFGHFLGLLCDRGEEPSRPVERAEVARVVRAAVSGLAGRQRTAVELHQFEDRTYNEVAASMAMSPEAAKSLLYRARNQLRESLAVFMSEAR